jgi:uncharacterized cofD-like protein
MNAAKKIVCLGGGIGTVNLAKGLKEYTENITFVISMADDGGSGGRIRRLYNMPPPGDLVSCMAALAKSKNPLLSKVLTYRFPGDRYAKDDELSGHKLGNLLMVAMQNITGSFEGAISLFQQTFDIPGIFLPATDQAVSIQAITHKGEKIKGEETIDLGKYSWKDGIEKVSIHPTDAKAGSGVITAIESADVIVAGPGDLYTTILPTLIVPQIRQSLKKSTATKILVINIANKPYETHGYSVEDFIQAITDHLGYFPFSYVLINNNFSVPIPKEYHYEYVLSNPAPSENKDYTIIERNLVDPHFPLYHNSEELAKAVDEII